MVERTVPKSQGYTFATSNLILIDTPLQLASPVFAILCVFLESGRIGSSSCNILICGMKNFLLLSSCSKKTSEITRRGTIGDWTKTSKTYSREGFWI